MFRIMSESSPNAPPVHRVTHELGQLEAVKCTGNVDVGSGSTFTCSCDQGVSTVVDI